ncbi:DUF1998 domain-containing protein [Bacillus thuringiensis]|uniref:MrfA-like Zn-binding domain-containing protein n=3 Tax=Bacillus thuringiensis TaxID=1428 RepID=A0A9W3XHN3_BACTU|nr:MULTISPECIES: DUF1998 domain-containing protein [Bacillus cereus group]AFQ16713.1 hypothetical protein BTG_16355 [Bacillus thuringiensis HD-771]AQY37374.1 hypothetical protein B4918_04895 [Bacillus thuringiensis]MCU5622457.1 DUF1998 domain-containing protein [Bacillus cereus]MEB4889813.1 DUF1998 domain-containing protein [Bacillus thuringiensis]MEC2473927.1 DUF1998 domain-containing protein [Bacillus thuringiensis]
MSKIVGNVRPSQLITTFGPGAIVDLPDFSVIMAGTSKWEPRMLLTHSFDIKEPRLKKKLKIGRIMSIPIDQNNAGIGTIPAYRFPEYHVCPNCRKLGDSRNFTEEEGILYCQNYRKGNEKDNEACPKVKTYPVRFLTACKRGHIDDFSWGFYVHQKKEYDQKKCELYLEDTGNTGSLRDLVVHCATCKIKRSISEAFANEKLLPKCQGRRPWLGRKNRDGQTCDQQQRLLLRGASNLYFTVTESSIVIPLNSHNPLEELIQEEVDFEDEELISDKNEFETFVKRNKKLKAYDKNELWAMVQRIKNVSGDEEDLLTPEWDAITSGYPIIDEPNFEVEQQASPIRFQHFIEKLIRVKRLKEVMVIKGFTRIDPLPDATLILSGEHENNEDADISKMAPLSDPSLDWYPGVESYGEGIFISLNEETLKKWEEENGEYAESLKEAHRKKYSERDVPEELIPEFPGIRYVLLHTLSHSLIRELCMHSGYSSSALKERIYCNERKGMAGILIYTATVDSEGSLGGLVELGKTRLFESILSRALSSMEYCSGDPLCAEHDPEKLSDVNGAACHSCLLIPETSCERSNHYLDRSVLISTVSNHKREFFNGF